jgi:hypothetical protein
MEFLVHREEILLCEMSLVRAEPCTGKPMGFEEFNALIEEFGALEEDGQPQGDSKQQIDLLIEIKDGH